MSTMTRTAADVQ